MHDIEGVGGIATRVGGGVGAEKGDGWHRRCRWDCDEGR